MADVENDENEKNVSHNHRSGEVADGKIYENESGISHR